MENYFNYFTEIEEHFLRRRGGGLLLSTLDWALIETWKEAGIPLEAALRGIDTAFESFEKRPSKTQKVNSLAYCAQAVLAAAEDIKEAAVGAAGSDRQQSTNSRAAQGLEPSTIAAFLRRNADDLRTAGSTQKFGTPAATVAAEAEKTVRQLAHDVDKKQLTRLEDLERHLTVLEEKLFAALLASTADEEILMVRAEADRELAPYRRKMSAAQIEQLQKQYVHKRLLEKYSLPRLSLFYL